jgi:AcrR family transcriptional regulator
MTLRAESQRATTRRILDAARAAFLEHPYESVTLAGVAAAAGVSHQTVLNHFDSKEGLFAAFGDELAQEIQRARERARPGEPGSIVSVLIDQYERFGDANARWELLEERSPIFAEGMREAREHHRAWLERQFAPWLAAPQRERNRRLALLHVATDVKTWKLLRRHLGLGRRTTGELMLRLIEATLAESSGEEQGPS